MKHLTLGQRESHHNMPLREVEEDAEKQTMFTAGEAHCC